jgi:hypothetical protein
MAYAASLAVVALTLVLQLSSMRDYAASLGGFLFCCASFTLLIALLFADSLDVGATSSGFPKHLFLLPIRSFPLALWPMLFGAFALGSAWLGFAFVAIYPRAGVAPTVMPVLALVAVLSSLQATLWSPCPVPFGRSILAIFAMVVPGAAWPIAASCGVSNSTIAAAYAVCIVSMFGLAIRGVRIARSGGVAELRWTPAKSAAKPARTFPSAMAAQAWYEGKHNGLILPMISIFAMFLYIPCLFMSPDQPHNVLGDVSYRQSLWMYLAPVLLLPIFAGMDSCCSATQDNLKPDLSLVQILAVRPMADASLVEAKMRMAIRSVGIGFSMLLVGPLLLAMSAVQERGRDVTAAAAVLSHATMREALLGLLVFACIPVLAWKEMVSGMWMRVSHSQMVRLGPTVALLVFLVGGLVCAQSPGVLRAVQSYSLLGLAILAGLKLLAALSVGKRVRDLGLVAEATMRRWTVAWLTGGALAFFCFATLLPSGFASPATVALMIFLALPLVRVQLAILTLHANRHRS